MKLVKVILEIKYQDPAPKFNFVRDIIGLIGAKIEADKKPVFRGGVEAVLKDKEAKVLVESDRLAVNLEKNLEANEMRAYLINLIVRINQGLMWGKVRRIGVRSFWIEPVSSFQNLLSNSKKLFVNSSLIEEATDIGIALTLTDEDNKINFRYGPMKKQQFLREYKEIKENLDETIWPDSFAFMDFDYYTLESKNFSKRWLESIWDRSVELAQQKFSIILQNQ